MVVWEDLLGAFRLDANSHRLMAFNPDFGKNILVPERVPCFPSVVL